MAFSIIARIPGDFGGNPLKADQFVVLAQAPAEQHAALIEFVHHLSDAAHVECDRIHQSDEWIVFGQGYSLWFDEFLRLLPEREMCVFCTGFRLAKTFRQDSDLSIQERELASNFVGLLAGKAR